VPGLQPARAGLGAAGPLVRKDLIISAIVHAAVVAGVLILHGAPTPLQAVPPAAIAVDLVPAGEIGAGGSGSAPDAEPGAPGPADPARQASAAPAPAAEPPAPTAPPVVSWMESVAPVEHFARRQAEPEQPGLDSTGVERLLSSPMLAPGEAFAQDTVPANLARGEVAALKAQLDRCWTAPPGAGAAPDLRVVLRVHLKPDGALLAEPNLLAGTGSAYGPALVNSAKRALRQCQPYRLPADKYDEWKALDLSFAPDGLRFSLPAVSGG
jgi:hypothetical protein